MNTILEYTLLPSAIVDGANWAARCNECGDYWHLSQPERHRSSCSKFKRPEPENLCNVICENSGVM